MLLLLLSGLSFVGGSLAGSKPHLIFILQDDAGHYDYAFNGNPQAKAVTANISALASDGIVLKSHYTHWHCSPTRRSFISGRLPVHHHEQLSSELLASFCLQWCPYLMLVNTYTGIYVYYKATSACIVKYARPLS